MKLPIESIIPDSRLHTCWECLADFETADPDDELCPTCHRQYLRETVPEALAEWDDQWAEGVVLPQATDAGGGAGAGA